MKAIITVTGRDSMGIIAKVATACADVDVNIIDISQSVLKEYFAMIMLVDIDKITIPFTAFVDRMTELGHSSGLEIHTMHEDIFNAMHRI
ncbi:MAG: ACT domain-containing protein [Clostridiales bacterium]|nr:ACT domain-containing protein [Clostridiales bacterium]